MGVFINIFLLTFLAVVATNQGSRIGGQCQYDKDCNTVVAQTFCERQERCACVLGFYPDENNEMCLATVGATCDEDRDCNSLQYAECRQEVCSCQRGYVPHPNANECLPEAFMYRSPCKESIQCTSALTDGSTCYQDKCICLSQYHNFDNKCVQNKGLNDACTSTDECYINEETTHMVECDDRKCVCKDGYQTIDNIICRDEGAQLVFSLTSLLLCFMLGRVIA